METQAFPEEKESQSDEQDPLQPVEYDMEDIVELQSSLGGCASHDFLLTAAMAFAVGDREAKEIVRSQWGKMQKKMKANIAEMQKRQEGGTENIRAERGKRSLEG